jgi:hypothetical protein
MRAELINEVADHVRGFEQSYAPRQPRRRLIYEALSQGVQYVLNNGVEGTSPNLAPRAGFRLTRSLVRVPQILT